MKIKLNEIVETSKVQGPGERFAIWVQGCSIHCKGCRNFDTWDPNKGKELEVSELITQILKSHNKGLSISGGEPLDQFQSVLEIVKNVFGKKNIFLCSGYTFNQIKTDTIKKEILNYIDVICSGPFIIEELCHSEWKGSKNQEVIYLTETGKELLNLPVYKKEYRINKFSGKTLITGFSI